MLVPLSDPEKELELEQFRIDFEKENGPTDLTRRYTTTWPDDQKQWLADHEPKRWFDGLPPFAKAYFLGKIQHAAREGSLDNIPDSFITLFIKGELRFDEDELSR